MFEMTPGGGLMKWDADDCLLAVVDSEVFDELFGCGWRHCEVCRKLKLSGSPSVPCMLVLKSLMPLSLAMLLSRSS